MYRYLIINVKLNILKTIPESVLQKAFIYNSSRYLIVKDWIDNNLPPDQNQRTRRDIFNFLKENRITFKEINITGI